MKHVYLIECKGWVKVGYSSDPWTRLSGIQVGNPFPCVLWADWPEENAAAKEQEIHTALVGLGCQQRGEWFEVSEAAASSYLQQLVGGHKAVRRPRLKPGRPGCRDTRAMRGTSTAKLRPYIALPAGPESHSELRRRRRREWRKAKLRMAARGDQPLR